MNATETKLIKILSIDGGGIRGVFTTEILCKLEQTLAAQYRKGDDFVLADYFDYVGGIYDFEITNLPEAGAIVHVE